MTINIQRINKLLQRARKKNQSSCVFREMAAKFFKKIFEGLLLAFSGYEIGKNTDDHETTPNITVIVPPQKQHSDKDETSVITVALILVLTGIIILLIALFAVKYLLSKFTKRVNRANALQNCEIPLQRVNQRARAGTQAASELHVCP